MTRRETPASLLLLLAYLMQGAGWRRPRRKGDPSFLCENARIQKLGWTPNWATSRCMSCLYLLPAGCCCPMHKAWREAVAFVREAGFRRPYRNLNLFGFYQGTSKRQWFALVCLAGLRWKCRAATKAG